MKRVCVRWVSVLAAMALLCLLSACAPSAAPYLKQTESSTTQASAVTTKTLDIEALRRTTTALNQTTTTAKTETAPPTEAKTQATQAAKTTQAAVTQPAEPQSVTVYITDTGSKYHAGGCQYLKKSKHAIDLSDAKRQGYEPCSKCHPPQ
ncbi:MAG: hypothetical protein ACI39E_04935 [Acutalibacteraceae bacterium]